MTSHSGSLGKVSSSAADGLRRLWGFVKKHRELMLLVVSIVLIALAVSLASWLTAKAFQHEFSCTHLLNENLHTSFLCSGIKVSPADIWHELPRTPKVSILPRLEPITTLLEPVRRFIVSTVIFALAVVSLALALIVGKVKGFVEQLWDPIKRRAILTNINLWLLIFAIFCGLFYFQIVVSP